MRSEEIPQIARVIARAFAWHEPWGEFCFPDESVREDRLAALAEYDLSQSYVPAGCAWTVDGDSVALWIPPVGHPMAEHFGTGRREEAQYEIYGERADLIRANDELIARLRPEEPHWYLDTLATDPPSFGRGLAARLLDHGLARLDGAGKPSALDSHIEKNVRYYERWGYREVSSGRLPGEQMSVTVMWRDAREPDWGAEASASA